VKFLRFREGTVPETLQIFHTLTRLSAREDLTVVTLQKSRNYTQQHSVTPFCCPFTWHKNDKFCSRNILYPSLLSCPLRFLICNLPSRRGLLFDGGRKILGKVGQFLSDYTALFPEGNNLHSDSCGSLRSPKRILYRMIKKSLYTCFLYCNHQVTETF